ncbi:hypothetical protein [Bradyrhizobium icense]|uniref:Uncharacterized protein n=1 Tax=Bradyrhizobium icense TaxID=1274631 RepID=A0A1B1UPI6_9BRAD|nr:hypothetical protein [Bradyrhizobium icense]ANW04729.1 hypothetical protein LMTR13_35920 [Bradyrhizobium icense]
MEDHDEDGMPASEAKLGGAPLRESSAGAPLRLAIGADGRAISVGIAVALCGLARLRRGLRGTNLSLAGNQTTVAAQHPDCVAAPRAMKRFEDTRKEPGMLRSLRGLVFNGVSMHR